MGEFRLSNGLSGDTFGDMPSRNINGFEFEFVERGSGTPIVSLHGFPLDSRMWEAQIAEFSTHHRAIAPDFRGFGKSKSQSSFSIADLADDVHALLRDLNALPCVLAGLSMGGYVALAFCRKFMNDLRGLILLDTKAEGDSPQQKEGRQKMIDLVRREGSRAIAQQMLPKLVAEEVPHSRPALVHSLHAMMEACPAMTIEHALAALRDRPDQTNLLPTISIPTLVVVGETDSLTPPAIAQAMKSKIPNSSLAIIRGAGHMAPMEQPGQVNLAIGRFLQKIS